MNRSILISVVGVSILTLAIYFSYLWFLAPSDTTIRHTLGLYKPQVVGFLPYWLYGKGKDTYRDDVTTLTYFGLALSPDGTIRKEDAPTEGEPGWTLLQNEKFQGYLKDYADHGVTLSLLVQNMVEDEILTLLENPEGSARTMISEVEPIMRANKFTDLNLDIESFTVASDSTRAKYVAFVQEVKNQLQEKKLGTLTVELTPKSPILPHFLDVEKIGAIADFVILMAYDYHYVYSDVVGPVAPLGGVPGEADYDVTTAVAETVKKVPNEKLILGIPLYGYEWETMTKVPRTPVIPRSWQTATHSRVVDLLNQCDGIASGEPTPTPQEETSGDLPFDPASCVKGFDPMALSPYLIFAGETPGHFHQIWYENEQSLKEKYVLAKKQSLAGVAFWALGYDGEGLLNDLSTYKKGSLFRGYGRENDDQKLFTLASPTNGLTASVASSTGVLKVMRFGHDTYSDEKDVLPLRMGEALFADATSSAHISIDGVVDAQVSPGGDVYFVNGMSPNILFRHRGGDITYEVKAPIFIRVLHALFELSADSQFDVSLEGSGATVTVVNGSGKVSAVDGDNTTTTTDISENDRIIVNGSSQTVRIR